MDTSVFLRRGLPEGAVFAGRLSPSRGCIIFVAAVALFPSWMLTTLPPLLGVLIYTPALAAADVGSIDLDKVSQLIGARSYAQWTILGLACGRNSRNKRSGGLLSKDLKVVVAEPVKMVDGPLSDRLFADSLRQRIPGFLA